MTQEMPVKIYTWADKEPSFLYKQYEAFKKFVKDENWEFVVFNNTPFFAKKRGEVKKICKELGVKCLDVRFRTFVSGAARNCAWGIHWAYHRFFRWQKDTIQVIIDSDMFLIKDVNFNEYLGDNHIAAVRSINKYDSEIQYLWNGFVILKGAELPDKNHFNYNLCRIKGIKTDVGGMTYHWLKSNPSAKVKYIKITNFLDDNSMALLPDAVQDIYKSDFAFQFLDDIIFHYRAGSNWQKKPQEWVDAKKACFEKLLNGILRENQQISVKPEFYQSHN